jgi:hypothetical protein
MSTNINFNKKLGITGGTGITLPSSSTPAFSNTKSILLDGIDDYVDCGNAFTSLTSFSVSAWVKTDDKTSDNASFRGWFSTGGWNTAGNFKIALRSDNGYASVWEGGSERIVGTSDISDNNWYNVVLTKTSSDITLFVNGIQQATVSNSDTWSFNNIYIGASGQSTNITTAGMWNGSIDEVSLFNSELSQSDVTSIYGGGTPSSLSSYSSLVSWWRFEGSGTTAIDSGSGSNDGTLINGVTRSTDVPPNPFVNTLSTYFDGVDDRVQMNHTLTNGYAELSVSTWVKYNNNLATSNWYHPIVARQGSLGNSFVLQNMRSGASSNGGELYFGVNTPNGNFNAFSGVVPSQNVWYNIVGTYDGSNVKIYIDGVLKGTLSASGNINTNNTILYLGDSGYGGYSQILNGNLDEVSIYSRGLTQSEVTDIFGQGVPSDVSSISDIEAYWRMGDGDTANTITDNVGSNNGTMVNMNASNFVTDVPTLPFTNTKSILLDGVDDYVNVADNSNLSFGNGTTDSPFSISSWVKMTDATRFYVLSKGLVFSTNYEYLLNTNASDKLGLFLYDSSNNSRIGRLYNTPLTSYENQWIHICSTYNGSGLSSGIKVYLNGVRIDDTNSNSGTYVAMENGNRSLNIGRTETGLYSDGNIDETSIFNSELSQSDVTSIYNGGVPNDLASLSPLSWWRCGDGDTSPTLTDNGSGGNDGTMTNFSAFSTDVPTISFANTKSILLDGVDDYVNCGTNLALLGSATTFSAWVKMTDATSFRVLHKGIAGSREYAFGMGTSDTLFLILYNGSTNYIGKVSTSTMTSYQGQWVHICATYDGSTNASGITLYVNGSVFNSNSINGGSYTAPSGNNNGDVYIGRYNTEYADGNVDEVSVFNTELSASDITTIYNGGEPNNISSLSPLSWWRCGDGDTAPILSDNGSASNDGTMTNFSTFSTDVPTAPSFTNTKSIALDGVDVSFSQVTYTGEFTTSFWIKPDVLGSSFLVGRQANSDYVWLRTVAQIRIRINFSTYIFSEGSGNNINTGAWNHLLISRDSSNNVSIFLNGASFSTSQVGAGDHRLDQIGKVVTSYYDGNVDETAFWDSDQSSNLATIYNSGVPNDISSLSPTLWYRMGDGDTSPTLTDNGSSSNNGTMTNFTTFSTDVPT